MFDPDLAADLRAVHELVVFTGAGMSAESGVPTFRDRMTGLWSHTDPLEIATPVAFKRHPQRVWDWHAHLAKAVRAALPNAGHLAIAKLERRGIKVTVVTQNIDNLHQRAGSRNIVELHGNLLRLKSFVDDDLAFANDRSPVICPLCDGYADWDSCDPCADQSDFAAIELCDGPVPQCPCCKSMLRPDIVWFGEMLDPQVIESAWNAVEACELLIVVGASLEVEPAASLPWRALDRGARIIEVNPSPTDLAGYCHAAFASTAVDVLPGLLDLVAPGSR